MASCNNAYLKTGIQLSVLHLQKAVTGEIASLQIFQAESFNLMPFENTQPTKRVAK